MSRQNNIQRRGMPVELMNELFGSMPFGNAFDLLAKMPNGLLARNVQKMINGIIEAMKNNKLNEGDCGQKLDISEEGCALKHSGPLDEINSIRAALPIPFFNLANNKPIISFYFEMEIMNKSGGFVSIGLCDQHFPLHGKELGLGNNSIGINTKRGIWIDRSFTEFQNDNEFFRNGDFVGIGIIIRQPNTKMECFSTWNGKLLGKAELPTKFGKIKLFPAVNLYAAGYSIRVNFGMDKWQFKNFRSVLE